MFEENLKKLFISGIFLSAFLFEIHSANAQYLRSSTLDIAVAGKNNISADSFWANKPENIPTQLLKENPSAYFSKRELFGRELREWSLNFYYRFPKDRRRFTALLYAVNADVRYWKDPKYGGEIFAKYKESRSIPVDYEAVSKWEQIYPALRNSYLKSEIISMQEKLIFEKLEIFRFLMPRRFPEYRNDLKLNLDTTLSIFSKSVESTLFLDSSDIHNKIGGGDVMMAIQSLFLFREQYGLSNEDLELFFYKASLSSIKEIRHWAKQNLQILKLKEAPFELAFNSIDGQFIDLKDYRNKVVLIDFWATWCGGCIGGMPKIKKLFDKYNSKGFEVISVSIDFESQINQVRKIKDKIGFEWPVLIIGGKNISDRKNSLYQEIWGKFGFTGVPQLLLLDKNGMLSEYNGILLRGDMESLIKKLL